MKQQKMEELRNYRFGEKDGWRAVWMGEHRELNLAEFLKVKRYLYANVQTIKEVHLQQYMQQSLLKEVFEWMDTSPVLETIAITIIDLSVESLLGLARVIQKVHSIQTLLLMNHGRALPIEGLKHVCTALKSSSIQRLILRGYEDMPPLDDLFEVIQIMPYLRSFSLNWSNIGEENAFKLAQVLSKTSIQHLALDACDITHLGTQAILSAILQCPTIEGLNLNKNDLAHDTCVDSIVELLAQNRIKELSIRDHYTMEQYMRIARDGVRECLSIEKLEVFPHGYSGHEYENAQAFVRLMGFPPLLKSLAIGRMNSQRGIVQPFLKRLHSEEAKILVALVSVNHVKRLGEHSPLRKLPVELIRRLNDFLNP